MGESFGAKARRFMGWYSTDQVEADQDSFEFEEELAEVTPIVPAPRPSLAPVVREEPVLSEADRSRIFTSHPESFNEAPAIGEAFRKGIPVIINLTDMKHDEARRLVDFAVGLTFGLHGVIEKVTSNVFLLSPRSIEVTGDLHQSRRGSFFNQG
ncbi:cell division protein SepF [Schaalia sp. 19OD2882]|uniref:cell division protein SepF n=1 Tax=Schaalia sp. 19OD2882 TaxID=2794089 RepID=UPI001C1EE685|nr:cell division protein SepF [Schaalia sp. 19OD2882]QWW18936.1 cell division protein SepF [Schaalia sp. 19OD2882]